MTTTEELKLEDFLDAPGDPKRFTNPGIARGGRREDIQRSRGIPHETGTAVPEINIDAAEKLWDLIWTSKSTLDEIDAHIFQMVYKRHLAENDSNERKAKEATQETLGGISDHIFNRHKNNLPKI